MSWDAGSIIGSLKLNINEYAEGMLQAESIAHFFPQIVIDFLEEPLLAFADVARDAAEKVKQAFEGTASYFHQVGLAAANLGASTQFISTMGAVAKASGIDIDSFSISLKFLEQRAADALAGEQGAAKGFADLGVKAAELTKLMRDPEAMFYRVAQGIAAIENPALRAQAASDLMGRAGYRMIALLSRGPEELRALAREMGELGAGVSAEQADMGEKWGLMEAKFDAAWTGIKMQLGQPILEFLTQNMDLLTGILKDALAIVRDIFTVVGPLIQIALQGLQGMLVLIRNVLDGLQEIFGHAASRSAQAEGEDASGAGGFGSEGGVGGNRGGVSIGQVNVGPLDAHAATSEIAAKLQPAVRNAALQQFQQLGAAASHNKVAHAIGGKGPARYSPGF